MNEFDNVVERRGTDSTKWAKYAGVDVLPFWVADMDFRAPQFVRDALQRRLDHGVFGYSDTPPELVHAAVAWLDAQFGWAVKPDWLVWIPGVVTGMNLACRAVGTGGDSVMMNVPVYYPFLAVPGNGGRNADRSAAGAERCTVGNGSRRDGARRSTTARGCSCSATRRIPPVASTSARNSSNLRDSASDTIC